jgi:hypothetical protein
VSQQESKIKSKTLRRRQQINVGDFPQEISFSLKIENFELFQRMDFACIYQMLP